MGIPVLDIQDKAHLGHRQYAGGAREWHVFVGPNGGLVELRVQHVQVLAEVTHLVPVARDVVEVTGEVGQGAVEDLGVQGAVEAWIGLAHDFPGEIRVLDGEVHGAAHGLHEALEFVGVLVEPVVVRVGGGRKDKV